MTDYTVDSVSVILMQLGSDGYEQKRFADSIFLTVAKIGALHKGFQFTTSFFMPKVTAAFFASSMLASLIKIDENEKSTKVITFEN